MAGIKGQKHNPYIEGKYAHINKNDVVFTPDWLAEIICSTKLNVSLGSTTSGTCHEMTILRKRGIITA